MEKFKKVIKWLVSAILIAIIIINFTLIIKSELNKDEIADFLGYTPFIVATGSMDPELKIGDVIITKKVSEEQLNIGDIISYHNEQEDIVVTHRIVRIEEQGGEKNYIIKGDNNNIEDNAVVTIDNIQGKYIFSIPFIGKIASYTATPMGLLIVISIIILAYIIIDIIGRMIRKNNSEK